MPESRWLASPLARWFQADLTTGRQYICRSPTWALFVYSQRMPNLVISPFLLLLISRLSTDEMCQSAASSARQSLQLDAQLST